MKISGDDLQKWKVVQLNDFSEVKGVIAADDQTGEVQIKDMAGETKDLTFGNNPPGIKIVRRGW